MRTDKSRFSWRMLSARVQRSLSFAHDYRLAVLNFSINELCLLLINCGLFFCYHWLTLTGLKLDNRILTNCDNFLTLFLRNPWFLHSFLKINKFLSRTFSWIQQAHNFFFLWNRSCNFRCCVSNSVLCGSSKSALRGCNTRRDKFRTTRHKIIELILSFRPLPWNIPWILMINPPILILGRISFLIQRRILGYFRIFIGILQIIEHLARWLMNSVFWGFHADWGIFFVISRISGCGGRFPLLA